AGREFVTRRGFIEVARSYAQVLAVASAPLPTRAIEERVTSTGMRVTTLAAVRDALGDGALEAAWDLHSACRLEHGGLGRATPQPFADWLFGEIVGGGAVAGAGVLLAPWR